MNVPPARVLLVDDDRRLADMLATYLRQAGLEVEHAATAAQGLQRACGPQPFDAMVLDLMLPDGDGLDVCRRVRGSPRAAGLPILMLTAKGDPLDRVIGLELGADDYLPKPFEPRELLARLRALMRRPPLATPDACLNVGALRIDPGARRVSVDGADVALTSRQFDLLLALASRAGQVLSRDRLLDALGGDAAEPHDRAIDVQIGRLRAAMGDDPKRPRHILTVRGAGYCLARPPAPSDA